MVECRECDKKFKSNKSLHAHIKSHKKGIKEYYIEHFPRYDKYSGKPIQFKNYNQYFNADFNSKRNLKLWLKKVHGDIARSYCAGAIQDRVERKGIKYAPCEVELRTLQEFPPLSYFEMLFNNYAAFFEAFGLKNKYKASKDAPEFSLINPRVIIDTRETKPRQFPYPSRIAKLDFGDYYFYDENGHHVYFERKSPSDFFTTLSGGLERFVGEIKRAGKAGEHLIVIVESTIQEINGFRYNPKFRIKTRANAQFLFNRVRQLIQEFEHLQFLFVKKEDCRDKMQRIFRMGGEFRDFDLQYLYNQKLI